MKNLYIPVETAARELDGKLLLALHAVQRDCTVVLGNRSLMSNLMHRFEPGIFLTHNFNRRRLRILKIIKQLGHRIVAMDEEGLVWLNRESYLHRRVDARALNCIDTIYAWGPEQVEVLGPLAQEHGVEIIAAGNPRADLLRPPLREMYRSRADELRDELGDFILINSNFGILNFALAEDDGSGDKTQEELRTLAKHMEFPEGFFTFRYEVFRGFLEMLPQLATRFPNRKIVVRPHPSENPAVWLRATAGLPNVMVKYDAELVPWLLAASAIIHNGCTTAIEASLLGKSAVMYRPVDGGEFEIEQPLRVSLEADNPDSLLTVLANVDEAADDIDARLAYLVSGLEGMSGAEHIAQLIADSPYTEIRHPLDRFFGKVASHWRAIERHVRGLSKTSLANATYVDHKFPPMLARTIEARLAIMANLLDLPAPKVTEYSDRVYTIKSN